MANEQSNSSLGDATNHVVDGAAPLTVTSPNATSSLAQGTHRPASTSPAQSPPSRPLWNTQEGRIAGFKRMIEINDLPEQRANLEALIRYYEEGGKVPEGYEEVWAIEGEVSLGTRRGPEADSCTSAVFVM